MRKIFAIALVLVLALSLLTACGGNTPGDNTNNRKLPESSSPPATSTVENNTSTPADNSSTPADNSSPPAGNNESATGTKWPSDWPSDVPKLDGTVISAMGTSGTYDVAVTVTGKDVCDKYCASLVSAGYTEATLADNEAGYTKTYTNSKHSIMVMYVAVGGNTVTLEVAPAS